MAERAAHLTSATTESKPTIFEVLAQENLMISVRPALHHASKVIAESRPDKFGWILAWYDEIYLLLDSIVQNYYLRYHSGSFAENFYGMKRICQTGKNQSRLSQKQYWKSLICLVLVPYIKNKIDDLFEELRHNLNIGRLPKSRFMQQVVQMFVAIYPYVTMSWEGCILAFHLLYMFDKSLWHSPLIRLSGTELRHLDIEDMVESKATVSNWNSASLSEKLQISASTMLSFLAQTLSTGLSIGVFFLQFLDWWYASDTNAPALMSLPVPDAPKVNTDINVPSHELCPLCLKTRSNDTVLSVSGYVFCYPCIHEYIGQHKCCPVTSYPASTQGLVKLYPPT